MCVKHVLLFCLLRGLWFKVGNIFYDPTLGRTFAVGLYPGGRTIYMHVYPTSCAIYFAYST